MSILWIYDKPIDPRAGGTERATHLVANALADRGYPIGGYLVFEQDEPRDIRNSSRGVVEDLYTYLRAKKVDVVVNQIGYSSWLLEEFLARGGQRWREEGGRIVTCLHFDPLMFSEGITELVRGWRNRTAYQRLKRCVRIALLPLTNLRAIRARNKSYSLLIASSDRFVILSESHRAKLERFSRTKHPDRIVVVPNLNSFRESISEEDLQNKANTALIVGRLDEPQKRVSLALKAWSIAMQDPALASWKLKVVGDGAYRPDYEQQVRINQIPNVEFLGRTDPTKFYREASIYLHTAKREGWGLTITEAMQNGAVPIVMNSCSVFAELIDHGKTGILSADRSVERFSDAIVRLVKDAPVRQKMALTAVTASQLRDDDIVVSKWSDVLS